MKIDRLAVRKARLRAGKTQLEVARLLKVTELKVSRWECGREPIRPEDAQRFILALDSEALVS
jgi:transcriptional regulator with XRE-family HTH domain